MSIKFLVSVVTDNRGYKPGDKTFWADEDDALRLIAAGIAEEVENALPEEG